MSTSFLRVFANAAMLLLAAVVLLAAAPRSAAADPCGCRGGFGPYAGGRSTCSPYRWRARGYRGSRSCRPCREHLDCLHEYRFVSRGQSWALLRRYLHRIRIEPNHFHARSYWYRRYPVRYTAGWRGAVCIGHDYPTTECPLVMAALGKPDEVPVDLRDPTPAERLARGMERFFRGAYEDAAADFAAARKAADDDVRPLYGQLFCAALGEKDWDGAVRHMRTLMKRKALSARDLVDLEGSFSDPDTFTRWREGLASYTKYAFHKVNAQVVAGWSFAATGDLEKARVHLKAALRFSPKHAVARFLLDSLDGEVDEADETERSEPTAPAPSSPGDLPARDAPENLARRAG